MMVLPLVEKGSLADLIVAGVVFKGIEYAWIVCSGSPFVKPCPHYFLLRLLESAALWCIFTCENLRFIMVIFIW
jgi:hypothetical protein